MDYESIRQKNIARNEKMIAELFGIFPARVDSSQHSEENTHSSQHDLVVSENINNEGISNKLDELLARYPHLYRTNELKEIMCYLDVNHVPAPPLHVVGPMGTGKTMCCKLVCNLYNIPCVYINCKGFNDIKVFIKSMFYSFVNTIQQHKQENNHSKQSANSAAIEITKIPHNFSDFTNFLQSILESKYYHYPTIHVIYAHFEELLLLDSTIASKLLKFNELISYKVKILVISRVGSRYRDAAGSTRGRSGNYHLNCMQEQVIFHPYTLQQLENIIISRARIEAESEEIKPLLLQIFSQVTKEALIHLTLRTRHITVLFDQVICIWQNLTYTSSTASSTTSLMMKKEPLVSLHNLINQHEQWVNIMRVLSALVMALPTTNLHDQKHRMYIQKRLTTLLESSNSSETGPGTRCSTDGMKYLLEKSVTRVMSASTLQGTKWYSHLPLSIKYLILASFLASHNPKESDDHTFGIHNKRSRRKKARLGTDPTTEEVNASDASSNLRSFTIERVMGIFTQIINIGGIATLGSGVKAASVLGRSLQLAEYNQAMEEITDNYGDAEIFSAVNTLVLQRYLVSTNGSSLDEMSYQCTVTLDMAQELATSLSFHLHDFMYQ